MATVVVTFPASRSRKFVFELRASYAHLPLESFVELLFIENRSLLTNYIREINLLRVKEKLIEEVNLFVIG